MEFKGRYTIPASPKAGCETVQKLSDTEFQACATLASDPPRAEEGLAPQFWVAGLIGIVILLLIVFSIVL